MRNSNLILSLAHRKLFECGSSMDHLFLERPCSHGALDTVMKEIIEAGLRIRKEDREQAGHC
jgi:hypothetical protein